MNIKKNKNKLNLSDHAPIFYKLDNNKLIGSQNISTRIHDNYYHNNKINKYNDISYVNVKSINKYLLNGYYYERNKRYHNKKEDRYNKYEKE